MNRRLTVASLLLAGALLWGGWAAVPDASAVALGSTPNPAETLYVPPPISCAPTGPPLCVPGPRPSHRVRPSVSASRWAPPAPGGGTDSRALPRTGSSPWLWLLGLAMLLAGIVAVWFDRRRIAYRRGGR